MPVEKAGLAVLAFDCLPGGNQLSIQFGDERHQMLVNEGKPVTDLEQRVAPGEPVPVGECPACGAVVHPVADDWWPVPQSALDRHYLSGRFNLAPEALPLVHKVGLDQVLAWFETTHGVTVGDNLPVSDFGLNAYFGFDPDKPNGECCYVNITVLR